MKKLVSEYIASVGQRGNSVPEQVKTNLTQLAPWLPTALLAIFGYLFQEVQDEYKEQLARYEQSQREILNTVTQSQQSLITIKTKQDAGRAEWDMRENRVIVMLEKLTGTVENNAEKINNLNGRIIALEKQMAANRKEWERRAAEFDKKLGR